MKKWFTDDQRDLIDTLIHERRLNGKAYYDVGDMLLEMETVEQATKLITYLQRQPMRNPLEGTTPFIPESGMYLVGTQKVRVHKGGTPQWYVTALVGSRWRYIGKRVNLTGAEPLDVDGTIHAVREEL